MLTTLLPINTVAKHLGVSTFTVRRYINRGGIPSVRVGNRVMVSTETVAKILEHGVKVIPFSPVSAKAGKRGRRVRQPGSLHP